MSSFILTVVADANFSGGNNPSLQILVGGSPVSAQLIASGSNTYTFFIDFTGSYPSSLALQFDPLSGDPGDDITISSVLINGQDVTADLTATILAQGASGSYNTAAGDFLFGRDEATSGDLGTPTVTGSGNVSGGANADVINGSAVNDRVRGIGGDDAIAGGAGNDTIFGEAGNDIITGEAGNDTVYGGIGDDLVYGGADNDVLIGEAGNDVLNGGTGDDSVLGDAGNDILYGEAGADMIVGGTGADYLFGDDGNDTLVGGAGNDIMLGGNNDDQMHGGNNDDDMYGESGADLMTGGSGIDDMFGGAGNDEMYGDAGNDQMDGGTDNDYLNGGAGDDTIDGDDGVDVIVGGAGADLIDGGIGNDILHGSGLDATAISSILIANPGTIYSKETGNFYRFVNSSVSFSTAQTNSAAATISGVAGHLVTITSDAENTLVYNLGVANGASASTGVGGNRIWLAGSDSTVDTEWRWMVGPEAGIQYSATGVAANNMYENWGTGQPNGGGAQVHATIWFNGALDDPTWDDRNDTDTHDYVIEWEGGSFSDDSAIDTISGGAGNDFIYGYGGNDVLNGDADSDVLFGGAGNDTINGGTGTDTLVGGAGVDTLDGGAGNDSIMLLNGEFASGESITGGADTDTIFLNDATTINFSTGTLATVENLTGSSGNDTVTFAAAQWAGFTTINLQGGTDVVNVQASGNISALGTPTVTAETGNLVGTAGNDSMTLTGAQLNAILIGAGTIDFGAGATDTLNITTTSADLNTWGATDGLITGLEIISASTAAAGVTITLSGQTEAFSITGGSSADTITGGSGADTINGGNGNDILTGSGGADIIDGGANDDTINLANGDFASGESLTGGANSDSIVLTNATTVDFSVGTLATIETLTGSGSGDTVTVSASQWTGFTTINLQGGTDNITVLAAGDISALGTPTVTAENGYLLGTGGNDSFTLTGTQLNAILIGSGTIDFGAGATDTLNITTTSADLNTWGATNGSILGLEVISASSAGSGVTISMSGQTEAFTITGSANVDTLTGGSGADTIDGGALGDTINGGAGSDILTGGTGNDIIYTLDNTARSNAIGATATPFVTHVNEAFGSNNGIFSYADVNDPANVTFTGSRDTGDGDIANGSLEIETEHDGSGSFSDGDGRWSGSFTPSANASNVQITFSYRHTHNTQNDNGEDSYVYFTFNGTQYDGSGGNGYLSTALGSAGATDTGWVQVTINLPNLTASTLYTLRFGLFHEGSNADEEDSLVRFDDITLTSGTTSGVTAGYTTLDADSSSSNTIYGGAGTDTLYGSSGTDVLYGEADADTLYSGSVDTQTALIESLISGNIFYSTATGNFYQVVSSMESWTAADAAAQAATLNGVAGHLATITSANEQSFLQNLAGGVSTWLGGNDSGTEGVWRWAYGIEAGAQFANSTGGAINGWYNNWSSGQPNDSNGTQDYVYMLNGGQWADLVVEGDGSTGFVTVPQYAIEWEGSEVFAALNTNTLNGGAGNDNLYGSDGIDIFYFDNTTSIDTIFNFNTVGRDKIDIDDIISYNPLTDNLANFVQLGTSGGNTTLSIDANGTAGGTAWTQIATINGVTGLNLADLMTGDNLIVTA